MHPNDKIPPPKTPADEMCAIAEAFNRAIDDDNCEAAKKIIKDSISTYARQGKFDCNLIIHSPEIAYKLRDLGFYVEPVSSPAHEEYFISWKK